MILSYAPHNQKASAVAVDDINKNTAMKAVFLLLRQAGGGATGQASIAIRSFFMAFFSN